jgi:hypothetical protein
VQFCSTEALILDRYPLNWIDYLYNQQEVLDLNITIQGQYLLEFAHTFHFEYFKFISTIIAQKASGHPLVFVTVMDYYLPEIRRLLQGIEGETPFVIEEDNLASLTLTVSSEEVQPASFPEPLPLNILKALREVTTDQAEFPKKQDE